MFFSSFVEIAFVRGSITFFNGPSAQVVTIKLSCEFLAVIKDELTVGAHFDSVFHVTFVD